MVGVHSRLSLTPMAQPCLSRACTWPDHSTHTSLAGKGGYAREEHDGLKAESANAVADGDYERAAALQQQAASSHYQTVYLVDKRNAGEEGTLSPSLALAPLDTRPRGPLAH